MLACPDALHAWLEQVSYTDLRSLAYGLRVDLPGFQDSPTSEHVHDCQLRIITQGNRHIDPERWHLLLSSSCRYPPFDNSSSPTVTATSCQPSAPHNASTPSSVDSISPIDLSSTSSSCLAQGDAAEESQVEQLLEMKGDVSSDWKEEEYEYPDDETLWMMMALADAPDEDDGSCLGEDGELDVMIPVYQDGDAVGPVTIPVSSTARSFDHLITKIPSSRFSSTSARSHGKRMRSTCYNFAAVTQAHKEMAKKQGFRPPRVTRFRPSPLTRFFDDPVTPETTSKNVQPIHNVKVDTIPDQSYGQLPMAVKASNEDIQQEQGILDELSIEEPLDMPYQAFDLPTTSVKPGKKTDKITRPGLKFKRTGELTVSSAVQKNGITTIPENETNITKVGKDGSGFSSINSHNSVAPSAKSTSAMAKIATKADSSSEEVRTLSDLSHLTPTCQEGERGVDEGAHPNLKLRLHSAVTSSTTPGQEDAGELSEEHSSATSVDSFTPVVSNVEGLRSSTHQIRATVHQTPEGSILPIPTIEVAEDSGPNASLKHEVSVLPSKKYTGFNIAKSKDQQNKPAKASRVSLRPNKRRPTIKSPEANSTDVCSPLQPRDLNRTTEKAAQLPSIKTVQTQEQDEIMRQTKTVVNLKRKRDVEVPSSDDDDCQSSLPVAKKPKKDATVVQAPYSATKAETTTSNSTSDEIQNRASATQEFALITRRCINLEPKQSSAIKTSSVSKFKRSDKPPRVNLSNKKHNKSSATRAGRQLDVDSKQSPKLPIEVTSTNEASQLSITVAPITRVPDGARTGNYLPHLSSIVPDDQQSTSQGGESQIPVSEFMERLDTWLAIPQEEIVWPTLASAWEASGATIAESPSPQKVVSTQHQERGTDPLKEAEFGIEVLMENQSRTSPPESREIFLTTAVPDEHTLEENSSDTFPGSDHEMDIDEHDFNQTTPTSTEVDLMEVDEEVTPIINPIRYPKLEADWRNGIPQYVRTDFMQQRKYRWESAPALAELRNQVTTANAINFAYDYNGPFPTIPKVTVPF